MQHDEQGDTHGRPHHLGRRGCARELLCRTAGLLLQAEVEAMDHHQAQPVERHRDRQQQRVGVRRDPADHQVRDEADDQRHGRVGDEARGHVAVARRLDRGLGGDDEQHREGEQEQLGIAPGRQPQGAGDGVIATGLHGPSGRQVG